MTSPPISKKAEIRKARTVLDDIPVTVEAVLGSVRLTVAELKALTEGDSLTLDKALGDPVMLRLNGVVIASGELVAVGENFGVRIQTLANT
ncbi:MAG: FliM/FliN family flagellar motor switch protein [Sphingomonadales bacterium]|nr:FliM/FliN family flagellar motor switch protein [Sphingomonadales bacterium]